MKSRQRDLLSPYLFLIHIENLSALIKGVERSADIHEVKICRGAPIVSHLFFAYDSVLFARATSQKK